MLFSFSTGIAIISHLILITAEYVALVNHLEICITINDFDFIICKPHFGNK